MKAKKYLSVFALYAKSSLLKILGVILLTLTAEVFFFLRATDNSLYMYSIDTLFEKSHTGLIFAIAFLLITVLLCIPTCQFTAQTGYTLKRLLISEKEVFFCQSAYNFLAYSVFLAFQVTVCFLFGLYYISVAPAEEVTNQTLFLAFYRNSFLHSIMPLSDVALWLRNLFLIVFLAFATSEFSYKNRRRKFSLMTLVAVAYPLFSFKREIGDIGHTVFTALFMLIVIAECISCIFFRNYEEEEETQSYE